MPRVTFEEIPDDGRLWAFGLGREISEEETAELMVVVDEFLEGWAAHGAPLRCARDFRHRRFLLVSVDESSVGPSGCSIDAMVRVLRDVEGKLGTSIVDHTPVWFKDDEGIQCVTRSEFKAMAEKGTVSGGTAVFDNTVTRVGQVRRGEWERPAWESWHGRAFFGNASPS